MARRSSFSDLSYFAVIGTIALLSVLIMITPVVVAVMTSFGNDPSLRFPPSGFSMRWYEQLFDPAQSREIHRAAANSLEIALFATFFSVLLAMLASLGLARNRSRMARFADSLFMSPLVLPGLTFGLAALVYFTLIGFRPSLNLIVAGHVIVIAPFVLRTTSASLSQLDPSLHDSSQSLGASWLYTLRRVTLPLIMPGIAAGAFLAFMASLDNIPVSLFLSDPRTDVLPIRMWGMMETTLDVRVAAVSGILVIAAFALMLIMEWTVGLTRRMQN